MKTKIYAAVSAAAVLAMFAAACSSNSNESESGVSEPVPASAAAAATSETATTADTETATAETFSVVVPFTAENGTGTITVSGDGSPVVAWFGGLPGEVSLDLVDADVNDTANVVEELVSFWFFRDENSGDVPPSIFVSASGEITDSLGTRYVVESQPLPAAPGTETTTTTTTAATADATTSSPETSEPAASTSTTPASAATTTTTTTSAVPATTSPVTADLSPSQLQVQVLNGSGVAGAAGRLSASLRDAGYAVLPAGNAPGRFATSAVYYVASEHQDEAELVAEVVAERSEASADGALAVASLPASGQIPAGDANVVVLIGRDDLGESLRAAESSSGLRRTPDFDTPLPLPASVPRDRFVPGLLDVQIFTEANDEGSDEMKGILNALSGWFNVAGRYMSLGARAGGNLAVDLEDHMDYEYLQNEVWPNIERSLEWLGFTPQNVCGAPAGYSFTDLIKPTREFDAETQNYNGDAIFTTDRLLELHGGQRINPEANLDFYVLQAVQAAHDTLRVAELVDETETMQIILCEAMVSPEGEIPEMANILFKSGFIPGVQPRESLLSQGTYHVKEISRNGNIADVFVCHPTLGTQGIFLHWREAGYRAEVVNARQYNGCQAAFEREAYGFGDEDTITFAFGEQVFTASDLSEFPRVQ